MSALGGSGQAAQDLIDAIKSLSRDLNAAGSSARNSQNAMFSGFQPGNIGASVGFAAGGATGAMIGEALGNNIFVNTALKAGRDFAADTFSNVAGDFAKYGSTFGSSFGESVARGELYAGGKLPYIGDVYHEVSDVMTEAGSRMKGMTDAAARGGAKFTKKELRPGLRAFEDEAGRAVQNSKMIDEILNEKEFLDRAAASSPRYGEVSLDVAKVNDDLRDFGIAVSIAKHYLEMFVNGGDR